MTVKALIDLLQKADPDDEVVAYNGDSEQNEPVTGILYAGSDHRVELCTDDID